MSDPDGTVDELVALAGRLAVACLARGLHVATAESCTGGLVGHAITEVPGSSAWYLGGAIAYSDPLKRSQLGVAPETIERHGAVSAQVAAAMAIGARDACGADLAIAVTGISGPTGGSEAKPVGLTYVAVADASGHDVRRFSWSGDRAANKRASAAAALALLLERIGAVGASDG